MALVDHDLMQDFILLKKTSMLLQKKYLTQYLYLIIKYKYTKQILEGSYIQVSIK